MSFTDCLSKVNTTQEGNTKDFDLVMPVYNLIECNDNYAKTSGSLRKYCRDKPDNNITNSESQKFKLRFTNQTGNAGCQ